MSKDKESAYSKGLMEALDAGGEILLNGGNALDAICAAVVTLENNNLFNAGKGAVFTNSGRHEMDASIMNGFNQMAGAVAGVSSVKNPVLLARLVMEKTDHVLLSGAGAEELALLNKLPFEAPDYFFDEFRHQQWLAAKDSGNTFWIIQTKKNLEQ